MRSKEDIENRTAKMFKTFWKEVESAGYFRRNDKLPQKARKAFDRIIANCVLLDGLNNEENKQ